MLVNQPYMKEIMKEIASYTVELPRIRVAYIETKEDLVELLNNQKSNSRLLHFVGGPAPHSMELSKDRNSITWQKGVSAYGDSIDYYTYTVVSVGDYIIWNQTKKAYVRTLGKNRDGSIKEFSTDKVPEELTQNILVPARRSENLIRPKTV